MKTRHLSLLTLGTLAAVAAHADDTMTGTLSWTVGTLQTQVTLVPTTQTIPVLVNGVGANYSVNIAGAPGTVYLAGSKVVMLNTGSLPFSNAAASGLIIYANQSDGLPGRTMSLDVNKKTTTNAAFIGTNPTPEITSGNLSFGGFTLLNGLTLRFKGSTTRTLPTGYSITAGSVSKVLSGSASFVGVGPRFVSCLMLGTGSRGSSVGSGGSTTTFFDGVFLGQTGVTPGVKITHAELTVGPVADLYPFGLS